MILGQSQWRTPYTRPAGANPNYRPQLPHTGFLTNIDPFSRVSRSMRSAPMYRPPLQANMGPQALPAVPMPAPAVAPTVPKAGGTAGFGASGFGSTGGVQPHLHVNPYQVMRSGWIPGVQPSGRNIRGGIMNAGARVRSSMPFQTAPLPIEAPVSPAPAIAPTPAATHGLGYPMRRRSWFHRFRSQIALNPEPVAAPSCETIGPRSDGLMVTICNGRVTEYRDAAGNVLQTPEHY